MLFVPKKGTFQAQHGNIKRAMNNLGLRIFHQTYFIL